MEVPDQGVPAYSETAEEDVSSWADNLQAQASELRFPITESPFSFYSRRSPSPTEEPLSADARLTHNQIISLFFGAVRKKNTELVELLVTRGFISPDCADALGETPLLAAVGAGNGAMVCALVALGATVDLYGRLNGGEAERTPLQAAAAAGRLALVRLLREDFGADDGLVAPDGQMALRLAADAGHRDVVAYLPARRGGAFRRWKTHHAVAWRRISQAARKILFFGKCVFWYLPRCLLWEAPKHGIVLPIRDGVKWAWKYRRGFGPWCVRQAKRVGRAVLGIPKFTKEVLVELWGVVKAIPRALKIALLWMWESLKKLGAAVGSVLARVVSLLHTAVMAVLDFFRTITLKDIWNGVCEVVRTLFVQIPRAIWSSLVSFGEASYKFLAALLGWFGKALWYFATGMLWIVQYVPRQMWQIVVWTWSSIAKGFQEILVWIDPKR
jgi:hypothetical protein